MANQDAQKGKDSSVGGSGKCSIENSDSLSQEEGSLGERRADTIPERLIKTHKAEQWGGSTSRSLAGLFYFVACFGFFNWFHSHQQLQ